MTWARTERGDYSFKVSEWADGWPFITLESRRGESGGLRICEEGFLSFDLKSGTTLKQAEEFAKLLNENIEHVCFTAFSEQPPAYLVLLQHDGNRFLLWQCRLPFAAVLCVRRQRKLEFSTPQNRSTIYCHHVKHANSWTDCDWRCLHQRVAPQV